jgi:hypothetical protein
MISEGPYSNAESTASEAHEIPSLAGEPLEKFALIHPVLERFAAIDEDDGHLVGELAPQFIVRVHVDLTPLKAASALQFRQCLFNDLA